MNSPIYVKVNRHFHYDGLSGHDVDIVGQLTLQYHADRIPQDSLLQYLPPQTEFCVVMRNVRPAHELSAFMSIVEVSPGKER